MINPVVGLVPLYSESTDHTLVSKEKRAPLTQSPDHVAEGGREGKKDLGLPPTLVCLRQSKKDAISIT